jgi:hypothetical protein
MDVIATHLAITEIEFVLVDIVDGGLSLTIRTADGTLGIVSVSLADTGQGYIIIHIENITVGGAPPDGVCQCCQPRAARAAGCQPDALLEQRAVPHHDCLRSTSPI